MKNKPINPTLIEKLSPKYFGNLLVFYKHKVVDEGFFLKFDSRGVKPTNRLVYNMLLDLSLKNSTNSRSTTSSSL